jgi:hypothetical protein
MEMRRKIAVIAGVFISVLCFAQPETPISKKSFRTQGILIPTGTIAPGFMFNHPSTNLYMHGYAEFYWDDIISYRGDVFWHVGAQEANDVLAQNHGLYYGFSVHKTFNRLDLYGGLQPGFCYSQEYIHEGESKFRGTPQFLPSASGIIGMRYFIARNFNYFIEGRYVYAQLPSARLGNMSLQEARLSIGLAFNFRLYKPKDKSLIIQNKSTS